MEGERKEMKNEQNQTKNNYKEIQRNKMTTEIE